MKKAIAITIMLTLVLAAVSKGADSPKGGSVGKGESFTINVPTFATEVKQGETQNGGNGVGWKFQGRACFCFWFGRNDVLSWTINCGHS